MRPALLLGLVLATPGQGCAQERAGASTLDPLEAYQTGAYEEAVAAYRTLARAGEGFPHAARGWAVSLAATGQYESGLAALDEGARATAEPNGQVELARVRGSLLRFLGRIEEAEASLRRSIEGGASDAQLARLELGELRFDRGERTEALELFDGFIDFYNGSSRLDAEALTAVGTALAYLGARDPELFPDAVRAFEEAMRADSGDPEPRVRLGLLFLDKYDSSNAGPPIDEALARNPSHAAALLAQARRAKFDGASKAIELTEQSLDTNPRFTEARAFLARLYLELEDVARAEAEAGKALETNPASLAAWTEIAAGAHLRGDTEAFARARDRVLELDPLHADLYIALADVAYRTHRYTDAVGFSEQALELDPQSWSGLEALGLNQLRVGEIDEGRATLETAFAGDPYNIWVFNTLQLLDDLAKFETTTSERFTFAIHPDEAALLSVYAPHLAEEAFAAMAVRYGYTPPTPISVEIYDRHGDFSVRTVGLTGLGALGVSFGSVLAMESPSARSGTEFNWGSTLWHEISHAFTLGYTDHRVPRWLSEGLAVLDERHAREGWGSDVDPGFLAAFREDRLPSLERFNYGFVRPAYPGQVQHSYYMASLLCEMIEETRGFDAILAMLAGYRDGLETPAVVDRALGADLPALDRELKGYIETRFGSVFASLGDLEPGGPPEPGTFGALLGEAAQAHGEGRIADAIEILERARLLFPEYAGQDAPTLLLGRLYHEVGDIEKAAEAYRAYTALNENHFAARIELAEIETDLGDPSAAGAVLQSAIWIDPFALEVHTRLAATHEDAGRWADAARERRALLALEPADLAQAHYRLAVVLHRGGNREAARRAVLDALEIAPNYDEALELLLEIRGEEGTLP